MGKRLWDLAKSRIEIATILPAPEGFTKLPTLFSHPGPWVGWVVPHSAHSRPPDVGWLVPHFAHSRNGRPRRNGRNGSFPWHPSASNRPL